VIEEADQLRLAREGDLDAFNALVHEHQSLVFSLCLRQLGQRQAAEDATQEAFIAAWRNLPSLRGPFRPWLLRIALNACTDEQRRRGRRRASSLDTALEEGMPEPPDVDPTPESAALTNELHDRLEALLGRLPEDQRLAIILCDVEGLEYTEIAVALGTNLGTVKSRIARGRARLRELLRAEPELLPDRYRQISRHERD
jgi:RNA polymerase sigma-70 factor (ECF subfamily)